MFSLTHQETIISSQLPEKPGDVMASGWQEVRVMTFYDNQSFKSHRQRLRAEVIRTYGRGSYGEIAVWASSSWKSIARLKLDDLPRIDREAEVENDQYRDIIDRLFQIGAKVVGG